MQQWQLLSRPNSIKCALCNFKPFAAVERRRKKNRIDSKHVCTLLTYDLLHWQRTSAGYRTMDLFSAFFNRSKWRTSEQNFCCIEFMDKKKKNRNPRSMHFFFACLLARLAAAVISTLSGFWKLTLNVLVMHFAAGLLLLLSNLHAYKHQHRIAKNSYEIDVWVCVCESSCRCKHSLFCYISSLCSFFVSSPIVPIIVCEAPLHSTQFIFFFILFFEIPFSLRSSLIPFRFSHSLYLSSVRLWACIESHLYRFISFFRIGFYSAFFFFLWFFNVWYLIACRHVDVERVMLTLRWCQCICRF